ncbi:FixH family protein [Humisphaera borealis]|uniref:FixH family protein n=1 Tax=Humisphaera borealis TaxID=2807512 RepID=A0A7M2WSC2_9BACT|nr:FixH family protein [Humisphaera borealis]QOV88408.1 FixH family protein [Humisphaera borealis]
MISGSVGPSSAQSPRPFPRRWLKIVVGLLIGHTALMISFVFIATRDASFSVDPDYYGKAVRWDADQARRRTSDLLGWNAALEVVGPAGTDGSRVVSLELTDASGRAIPNAVVAVGYFHHAHGREKRTAILTVSGDPRRHQAGLLMPQAGEWEFELTARAGADEFLKTVTIKVP